MDTSALLDEGGRMLIAVGLICLTLLVPMTIVGLVVSIFQAATSISEQTLSFVPKLIALGLCLLIFGGAIIGILMGFTTELFALISSIGR